jgi:hypothetical protein
MHPFFAQQLARDRIEQLQQAQRPRSTQQLRTRPRADGSRLRRLLVLAKPRGV